MSEPAPHDAAAAATRRCRDRGLRALALAAGFLLLAAFQSGIHSELTTHLYGGGRGDICIDTWVLSQVTGNLLTRPWQPFEGNIYFPSYSSVLYNDPNLGPAVLVLPLRLAGAGPVLLYNAAVLLSLTLGSLGFYWLARRLGATPAAALLAGIAIPYSSRQMAHLYHLNLLSLAFFPFFIGGLLRLLERPGWAAALVTGVAFALQAATSGYHAFSAALVALVAVAWNLRRFSSRKVWAMAAVALAVAGVLLYPYLTGFAWIGQHEADVVRDTELSPAMSMDVLDLVASDAYVWSRLLPERPAFFPGLLVLVLAGLALKDLRRDRLVSFLLALALAAYALALGPDVRVDGEPLAPGPFRLLHQTIPFMESLRHPLSFAAPGLIALGLLASLGLSRSRLGRSRSAVVVVLALVFLETVGPHPDRRAARTTLPAVYGYLATQPHGALLELPFDDDTAMWWAARHRLDVMNGLGAFEPTRYQALAQLFRKDWKQRPADMETTRWLEYLKTWYPIRYVLAPASLKPDLRAALEASSRSLRRIHETAEGDRVYLLSRSGRAPRLKRAFRDDQLREGVLTVRLRGAFDQALLNDEPLEAPQHSGEQALELRWHGLRDRVRRGLNVLELRSASDETAIELLELAAR